MLPPKIAPGENAVPHRGQSGFPASFREPFARIVVVGRFPSKLRSRQLLLRAPARTSVRRLLPRNAKRLRLGEHVREEHIVLVAQRSRV